MPEVASPDTTALDRCLITGRPGAPLIVVLGGITATRDVRGWWPAVVGEGRPVDTREFRVLCADLPDGGARADGRPERIVTTHDQADFVAAALDEIGVDCVHAFVGASYGGMVALAFAERYPDRLRQLIAISAPARAHPMSIALRSLQRRIVELGLDTGRPADAMAVARGLAMTTYRSAEEFAERFASAGSQGRGHLGVESYLRHHGEKFAAGMLPSRFLALSLSADLHCVNPAEITTPALLVAASGDTIVPAEQITDMASEWGGKIRFVLTATRTGHDAFLAEPRVVGALIQETLNTRTLS